jgi:hypothetical protein
MLNKIKNAFSFHRPWSHAKSWDAPLRALENLQSTCDALSTNSVGEAILKRKWEAFEVAFAKGKNVSFPQSMLVESHQLDLIFFNYCGSVHKVYVSKRGLM